LPKVTSDTVHTPDLAKISQDLAELLKIFNMMAVCHFFEEGIFSALRTSAIAVCMGMQNLRFRRHVQFAGSDI